MIVSNKKKEEILTRLKETTKKNSQINREELDRRANAVDTAFDDAEKDENDSSKD